jgi:hypothetical protein
LKPGIAGQVHIPLIGTINITPGTNRLLLGGPDTPASILAALNFGLGHTGNAADPGSRTIGRDVFTNF